MIQTAVFFAEGFEEVEALTVVDLLRRAKIDTKMVSVMGKKEVTGSHGITIETDEMIEDFSPANAAMLILPGGMPGTKNLGECELLKKYIMDFNDKDKYLAAICAGPTVFGKLGILMGKKACCYPGYESELLGAKVSEHKAVIDGNIITSRGVGTAIEFALAIIEELKGKKEAENIAESIIYWGNR